MIRAHYLLLIGYFCAVSSCDPYQRFGKNGDSLGPVEPVNFPPANLGIQPDGSPGNRRQSGLGAFTAVRAFAAGQEISYYGYPFPVGDPEIDPLRLEEGGAPYQPVPVTDAYVFDSAYKCTPSPGYKYDPRRDEVPYDQQGNIFTALPTASYTPEQGPVSDYVPVVAQIPVSSPSMGCQQPKSEETLDQLDGMTAREPDGKFLAFLIIDPGSPVFPVGATAATHPGVGIQRWGWYNRYLLAYLDGGEIPTAQATVMEGQPPAPLMVRRMVTQRLYIPRSPVMTGAPGPAGPGEVGAGYDVLGARRGAAGYSPVCAVYTYDAERPLTVAALPKNAATIEAMFDTEDAPLEPADPPYVFCLQTAVTP